MQKSPSPGRLLIFGNGSIGDFLMHTYVAQEAHRSGVREVRVLVPRMEAFFRELAAAYPYLTVGRLSSRQPLGWCKLLRHALVPTVVLVPPTAGRQPLRLKLAARLSALHPRSCLIGYRDAGAGNWLYGTALRYDPSRHYLEAMRDALRAMGIEPSGAAPHLEYPKESDAQALAGLGVKPGEYAVVHLFAATKPRSFSPAAAQELLRALRAANPSLKLVLTGGQGDAAAAANAAAGEPGIVVATGTPLPLLIALLRHAKLYVGPDTGVTHLACFVGARVLVAAHDGTPNWLPTYHPGATILTQPHSTEMRLGPVDTARIIEAALRLLA